MMGASFINSVRRSLADAFEKIPLKKIPLLRIEADESVKSVSEITYKDDVANSLSRGFYLERGAKSVEEAFELRDAGLKKPILILGYTFPYAYERMLTEGIRPAVFRMDMAKELDECAKKLMAEGALKEPAPIHLAVDTGMSRIGITRSVIFRGRTDGISI